MVEINEIIDFLNEISFPRAIGSEGNIKAQNIIKARFQQIPDLSFTEQPFHAGYAYMDGLLNIVHPLIGGFMILIFILSIAHEILWAIILSFFLFIFALFNRQIIWALQFRLQHIGKQYNTANLIFNIAPSQETFQTIVILAHYDSISHKLSPVIESIGYVTGFLGGLLFGAESLILLLLVWFSVVSDSIIWYLTWGLLVGIFCFIELFNKKGNESPGYIDNATGIAQLYFTAKSLSESPLKNIKLILVATGAEEVGDFGSYEFIEKYKSQLSPNTRFLIIDSLGIKDRSRIINGIGYPMHHWSPFMENIARKLLKENQISTIKFFPIPPFLQIASDHVPVERAGFEFLWFAATAFVYHSKNDTSQYFDVEEFHNMSIFIDSLIRAMDDVSSESKE